MEEIWTPQLMSVPDERKSDGGSYFDDEMQTQEQTAHEFALQTKRLLEHLNARPDHVVYVGSTDARRQLREVFNTWKRLGGLMHNPHIRIDYGVVDGAIRVGE